MDLVNSEIKLSRRINCTGRSKLNASHVCAEIYVIKKFRSKDASNYLWPEELKMKFSPPVLRKHLSIKCYLMTPQTIWVEAIKIYELYQTIQIIASINKRFFSSRQVCAPIYYLQGI